MGRDELTLIFFGFFVNCRYENRTNLDYEKLVNLTDPLGNLIPLDKGEGVPMF